MKKIIFVFASLVFIQPVFSKEKLGTDFGFGMKAGLNFNKVVASEWKDQFSTDPHAGLFVFVNRYRFGIQLEALWSQNSITTDSSFYGLYQQYYNQISDSMKKGTFQFTTISIPILLNIKLSQFLWLQGGPQYTANVATTDKDHILKSGKEIINQGNFNVVGGLWLQIGAANSLKVNAGVRYISGINNHSNLESVTGAKSEWQNQMVQVHIGLNL